MIELPARETPEVANIQKAIDEIKRTSLIHSGNIYDDEDEDGHIDIEEPIIESNAGFIRVMKYYNPKIYAFFSMIASIIGSFSFPLFGYIFSELMFIIMVGRQNPDYIKDRNYWCLMFLIMALGMGIVGFFQKSLFTVTGENLTYDVRKMLFRSLMYK
jgi:hypothetical protein